MSQIFDMSRARANEILDLWKAGAAEFTQAEIVMALYVTGDLDSHL
jgi:hypothetical protein